VSAAQAIHSAAITARTDGRIAVQAMIRVMASRRHSTI
jgi:hypothetical protein